MTPPSLPPRWGWGLQWWKDVPGFNKSRARSPICKWVYFSAFVRYDDMLAVLGGGQNVPINSRLRLRLHSAQQPTRRSTLAFFTQLCTKVEIKAADASRVQPSFPLSLHSAPVCSTRDSGAFRPPHPVCIIIRSSFFIFFLLSLHASD